MKKIFGFIEIVIAAGILTYLKLVFIYESGLSYDLIYRWGSVEGWLLDSAILVLIVLLVLGGKSVFKNVNINKNK